MTIYHKSVRYRLHKIEVDAYRPEKHGINCVFDDYDFKNGEVTVHYSCCDDAYLDPQDRRTMKDIDEEISRMAPRIVKETKISYNLPFHMGIKTILDRHIFDGEMDNLRSKAILQHPFKIPKFELKQINQYYERTGEKPLKDRNVTIGEIIG